ncbi:nitronate monooxygenase [Streptomyces sp. NPDC002596]
MERALEYSPRAVMLPVGDPTPYAEHVRQAGALPILQVTDLEEAKRAVDLGTDVIVAQGTESGGHGASSRKRGHRGGRRRRPGHTRGRGCGGRAWRRLAAGVGADPSSGPPGTHIP